MTTLLLDSGAFSAKYRGVTITLEEYRRFVCDHSGLFEGGAITLDVIGDRKASYENWRRLIDHGLNVIPVFHLQGDEAERQPFVWLERYLRDSDHIGIGGIAKSNTRALLLGLDAIWAKCLLDESGKPTHKVHGLGLTSPGILQRYPWYSVDSASCTKSAANGAIFVPEFVGSDQADYGRLYTIFVSDQRDHHVRRSYYRMPALARSRIRTYCDGFGFELDEGATQEPNERNLTRSWKAREAYNYLVFNHLTNYLHGTGGEVIIYHVCSAYDQLQRLTMMADKCGAEARALLSYYAFKKQPGLITDVRERRSRK